ncbi:ImmA/IrrE family metallo-endopeptidase [Rhodococcus jostii]|uniref:ImmA/IrrE family metallo-endopeptidase n=1 Tax=Rhodococcus jostii TaxID=132919 RepID=UPI00363F1775
MRRLYPAAAAARIFVVEGDIPGDQPARYYHANRCIVIRSGMPNAESACAFGHELGHAHFGHLCTLGAVECIRQERQADEYAASMLITEESYRSAERLCGPHVGAIAYCLDVTPRIVLAWCSLRNRREAK